MDFTDPADYWVKLIESKKKYNYLDFARELKKIKHESVGDTNCNWCSRFSPQRTDKVTVVFENKRASGDLPNDIHIKIGPNTKKNPGDLKRLAVALT